MFFSESYIGDTEFIFEGGDPTATTEETTFLSDIMESNEEWHNLTYKMMKAEHYCVIKNESTLLEASVGEYWGKVVEFFKKLWNRIAVYIKNLVAWVTGAMTADDKKFIDQISKVVGNGSSTTTGLFKEGVLKVLLRKTKLTQLIREKGVPPKNAMITQAGQPADLANSGLKDVKDIEETMSHMKQIYLTLKRDVEDCTKIEDRKIAFSVLKSDLFAIPDVILSAKRDAENIKILCDGAIKVAETQNHSSKTSNVSTPSGEEQPDASKTVHKYVEMCRAMASLESNVMSDVKSVAGKYRLQLRNAAHKMAAEQRKGEAGVHESAGFLDRF